MLMVRDLTVRFGSEAAVDDVTFDVPNGRITAMLGPSGSGKSTILRFIAGLEVAERGEVLWDGERLTQVPTHERNFGLMFQDYALFPHRTVAGNVGFGLRMRGDDATSVEQRVTEVLDWVGLAGFEGRAIPTLSGGEQQRVALARALAPAPRLLMLDEPVGSLDRQLRSRLVPELGVILRDHEITALYVTHDQDEAMSLADQLIVLRNGQIAQKGAPGEVWDQPADVWTARFLGFDNVFDSLPGVSDTPIIVRSDAVSLDDGGLPAVVIAHRFRVSGPEAVLRLENADELVADLDPAPPVGTRLRVSIDRAGTRTLG